MGAERLDRASNGFDPGIGPLSARTRAVLVIWASPSEIEALEAEVRDRVQRAIEAMVNTNDSLTEISLRVGFKCLTTFERQFRRELGTCPSDFRTQVQAAAPAPGAASVAPGAET